jgi:D-alanyl-D-alanine carboxypeptidase/D-alanyl-D-alanine-endopeptidase (penicillin-binding protein 4)
MLCCVWLAGSASADLAQRIDGIIGHNSQKNVEYSVHVVKADTGKTLYGYNAKTALVPASNMKIITTSAALKYLGPKHVFTTTAGLCGDTLVVIGDGDPLLGDRAVDEKDGKQPGWIFADIVKALKENGITAIKDLVVDSTVFDDERVHPNWPKEQLNCWYACEVSGVNYNDNCVQISSRTAGSNVELLVDPPTGFIEITNKMQVIPAGGATIGSYRGTQPNCITVVGRCKDTAGPVDVAIERPAAFFGYLLAEALVAGGIKTQGQLIGKPVDRSCSLKTLRQYSHSLMDCLARCNKDSLGLAAESLLKTIAAKTSKTGKNGSWQRGRAAVTAFLDELGIEQSEFFIDDGSGLSRQNELSANAITTVLVWVHKSEAWPTYRDSFAVGGVDGTIHKYFTDAKYKGKILGKTGYIGGVKSFSGVCLCRDGDYIFSILTNGANGHTREAINGIAKAVIDEYR